MIWQLDLLDLSQLFWLVQRLIELGLFNGLLPYREILLVQLTLLFNSGSMKLLT